LTYLDTYNDLLAKGLKPRVAGQVAREFFQEKYVGTDSVALYHGVDRCTVLRWIRDGILPAIRHLDRWLIKTDDAMKFKRPDSGRPKVFSREEIFTLLSRGIPQADVAEIVGCSPSLISRIVSGER
jgi:hypothetical protein